MSQPSLGQEIYSGAAGFGKIEAVIGVIIGTIIGLAMLIIGIVMMFAKNIYTAKTIGTIVVANCSQYTANNTSDNYNCSLLIKYTANGTTYSKQFTTDGINRYVENMTVDISYNPENPEDSQLGTVLNYKLTGGILIFFGIFIAIGTWIWLWITRRSKFAAAAGGVAGAWNLLRR